MRISADGENFAVCRADLRRIIDEPFALLLRCEVTAVCCARTQCT